MIHVFRGHFKPNMVRRIIDLTCYAEEVSIAVAKTIPEEVANEQDCTHVAKRDEVAAIPEEVANEQFQAAIPEEVANEQDCTHVAKRDEPALQENALYFIVGTFVINNNLKT